MIQASQGGPAPAAKQGLFKGVAVVIDDSVGKHEDGINAIIKGIRDGGGHAIVLDKLPDENADLENFSNVSFFIMDWNLSNLPKGQIIPPELALSLAQDNARFLTRLREHRHAPVFIFTHEDVGVVKRALVQNGVLHDDDAESHILIRNKESVGEGVYEVLNEWLEQTPSALTLRTWERSYLKAVNALFMDFHERNRYWPVIFWQGFKNDKVPPGDELGRLISRLVASRMHPFNADLSRFEADVERHALANADSYATSVLQVLEGERIVRSERLESTSFAPGDLFEEIDNEGKSRYFLNVRAECDCVIRGKPKDALLYLLKGRIEKNLDVNHDMGNINEKDNEAIVFGMMDGQTFRFGFRDLVIRPWNELADKRKARLLSPFITRVVQRYAAYSQRPGLPRIPAAVLPIREDGPADEATGDHASPVCSSCTDQCAAEDATSQENSAA